MEVVDAIIGLFANTAFPIAMCVALGWCVIKLYQSEKQRSDEYKTKVEEYSKEIKDSREATYKAIETIERYSVKLDIIQNDVNTIKDIVTTNK